jgi:hypothetical protein
MMFGFDGFEYRVVYRLNGERAVTTLFAHSSKQAMERLEPHMKHYGYISDSDVLEVVYAELT